MQVRCETGYIRNATLEWIIFKMAAPIARTITSQLAVEKSKFQLHDSNFQNK